VSVVQGSGVGVQGSGFRVQGAGFRVQGSGFGVWGSGFKVCGVEGVWGPAAARGYWWSGCGARSLRLGVEGVGFGVLGFRVQGASNGVAGRRV